jgi:glycosyltransferase involved in cell wall biosynthesis
MKIVFATVFDPLDVRRGSGTFYYLYRELERQGHIIYPLGPLTIEKEPFATRFFRSVTHRIFQGRYVTYLDPWIAQKRGKMIDKVLKGLDADLVLTSDYGIVYGLHTRLPLIIYTDNLVPADYHPSCISPASRFADIPRLIAPLFQHTTRQAIRKSALLLFPADFQMLEAKKYGADPKKIKKIPFGANISDPGFEVAKTRPCCAVQSTLNLLFIGKEWYPKGGDVALDAVELLRQQGINAFLHVVGISIPNAPSFVYSYGLLDKASPKHEALLDELFRKCSFLILPSQSEGSVIAPREAAAYGMPTLAYRIPGLMTSVADGNSGLLLPPEDGPLAFAMTIKQLIENEDEYRSLVTGARAFFEQSANWQTAVARLVDEIQAFLESQ